MTYRSLLISIVVALLLTPVAMASDWPQWRGPERDGTVADGEWPSSLEGLTQNWRIELGESYSGPIVTADRVFTTETHDKKSEIVTAIDRATGKVLWTREWEGAMKVPFFAARNGSWIRSTPAFDGERLIVGGIREVLVALDGDTGEEVWRIDFPTQYGTEMPPFGFVCSPMVDGEFVYVEAAGSFFKLQSATGEVVWRTERFSSGDMMSEGTFSSPVKATIAGREQILVQTRQELKGVDPETGEVLWSQFVPSFRGMNILTPLAHGDGIFTSSSRNASWFFDVTQGGEGYAVAERWSNKTHAYMSSPVKVGEVVYSHLGNGRLTAINLETGESYWTTQPMGDYWSMVHRQGTILALNEKGELLLIEASPESFNLLDQREVADAETWGHVAVSGNQIFVRELEALSAWTWDTPPAAPQAETTEASGE